MDSYEIERMTAREVGEFLDSGKGVLVDTLPPEHFEARHIPGAVNACVYEMVFLDTMSELAPDRTLPIVVYGAGSGSQDWMAAAEKLARAGYSDVAAFPGGLEEWREVGWELDGMAPQDVEPPHPLLDLAGRRYNVVPMDSFLHWTGRNNNGGHTGTLRFSGGELDATGDLSGEFIIDMTSIKSADLAGDELQPVLETHLNSDDFFFTTMFPEATFSTTRIKLVEDGEATRPNAMIQGNLSLRGVSNEIAFPAHIRNIDEERIAVLANLDFDRTQWGVVYGSSRFFQHLSYHVVYDFISVDFRLVLE